MFTIYADGTCIYDPRSPSESVQLVNPKLVREDNAAGSLDVTIPPVNDGYRTIQRLTTKLIVKEDDDTIWEGRVLTDELDFWNNRKIFAEGALAFLNDSVQPQAEFHNVTPASFLGTLLANHNERVSADRQILLGIVTVTDNNDSLYRYTNYETTLACINEKLVERLGGHLRIRYENGFRYLDYLADYPTTSDQTIEFGKNLSDFTRSWDASEYATVILPLGAALEESPIEALTAYTTVESVNEGSPYVQDTTAVSNYGWIVRVVHWENVTEPARLLTKAQQYLSEIQFDNMQLEITAADLHNMDVDEQSFKLLDQVRCVSSPHGMDRYFPIVRMEIQLDAPESTLFTLGTTVKTSLTDTTSKVANDILQKIESGDGAASILSKAQQNALKLIKMATEGVITIVQNEQGSEALYISDVEDLEHATRYWVWNLNGLAHVTKDGDTETANLAMTMDGVIVANRILTGILGDAAGMNYWNMDTGDFKATIGEIGGWKIRSDCLYKDVEISTTGNYMLDSEGRIIQDNNGNGITGSGSESLVQKYRFMLQPPNSFENAWMISAQRWSDDIGGYEILWGIQADGTAFIPEISRPLFVDGDLTVAGAIETMSTVKVRNGIEIAPWEESFSARIYTTSDHEIVFGGSSDSNAFVKLASESSIWGLFPNVDGRVNLGLSNHRWGNVYSTNGNIQTSDRNLKHDIRELGDRAEKLIMGLKPRSFKLNDGTSGRDHLGFIAQDVEELLGDIGITSKEFGGLVKYQKTKPVTEYVEVNGEMLEKTYDEPVVDDEGNPVYEYGLRYDEFIAPMVQTIQKLKADVDYLLKHR